MEDLIALMKGTDLTLYLTSKLSDNHSHVTNATVKTIEGDTVVTYYNITHSDFIAQATSDLSLWLEAKAKKDREIAQRARLQDLREFLTSMKNKNLLHIDFDDWAINENFICIVEDDDKKWIVTRINCGTTTFDYSGPGFRRGRGLRNIEQVKNVWFFAKSHHLTPNLSQQSETVRAFRWYPKS